MVIVVVLVVEEAEVALNHLEEDVVEVVAEEEVINISLPLKN